MVTVNRFLALRIIEETNKLSYEYLQNNRQNDGT